MTDSDKTKTPGEAIDAIVDALKNMDDSKKSTIIRAACDLLSIKTLNIGQSYLPDSTVDSSGDHTTVQVGNKLITDIRSFKLEKNPSTDIEMTALVAFYLQELASNKKNEVNVKDIVPYFKDAGYPIPTSTHNILLNAKNAGYFESIGKGKFKLNPVGYNLIAHNLPRESSNVKRMMKKAKK